MTKKEASAEAPAAFTRFDLEEALVGFDVFADHLDLIVKAYGAAAATPENEDRHINALLGVAELIRLHANNAFEIMTELIRNRQLN